MMQNLCENCGQPIDSGDMFCLNCGYMVGQSTMQAQTDDYAVESSKQHQSSNESVRDYSQDSLARPSVSSTVGYITPSLGVMQPFVAGKPGYCTECGARYSVGWAFCMQCGRRLFDSEDGLGADNSTPADAFVQNTTTVVSKKADDVAIGVTTLSGENSRATGGNKAIREPDTSVFSGEKPYGITTRIPDLSVFNTDASISQSTVLDSSEVIFPDDDVDDLPTMMYGDEDDMDAPTMVYDEPSPAYKLVRRRTNEPYKLPLPAILGKGSAATVRISGNRGISRAHAKVYESDGRIWLEDNGSTNKTTLNGVILSPGKPMQLNNGDVLTLADESFDFIVEINHV